MSYLVEEQRLLAARPAPRAAPHLRMTQGRFINVFIGQFISGVTQGRFVDSLIKSGVVWLRGTAGTAQRDTSEKAPRPPHSATTTRLG